MKARWSLKLKYDGVPIIDADDITEEKIDGIFAFARRKSR